MSFLKARFGERLSQIALCYLAVKLAGILATAHSLADLIAGAQASIESVTIGLLFILVPEGAAAAGLALPGAPAPQAPLRPVPAGEAGPATDPAGGPAAVPGLAAALILLAGLGLSACSTAQRDTLAADFADAERIVVAAQPVASEAACAAQAGANISTDILAMTGNREGAATSAEISKVAGYFCNGLGIGTPLPAPVPVPAPVLHRIAPIAAAAQAQAFPAG